MSFSIVGLNALLQGAVQFLGHRRRRRDVFFERVILKRHQEFETALTQHHRSLAPFGPALKRLADLSRCDHKAALEMAREMLAQISEIDTQRSLGSLERRDLARFAQDFEQYGYAFGGAGRYLTELECATLRTFASSIAHYFTLSGSYEHAHANLLNFLHMSVDTWLYNGRTEPAVVEYVAQELIRGLERMETAWQDVNTAFAKLEMSIVHDFMIEIGRSGRDGRPLPLSFRDAA